MVFFRIIRKNFTLLARSRSSAFMLLLGPLIVIALVGLFLSGKSSYDLAVGYYSPNATNLTSEFISALEDTDFKVLSFESETACVDKIKQGTIHTCIVFPQDFTITNAKSAELRFVVDYSRLNLVYKVIDAVSGILEVETTEVSTGLTSSLLDSIDKTIVDLDANKLAVKESLKTNDNLDKELTLAGNSLSELSFDTDAVSLGPLVRNWNSTNKSLDALILEANVIVEMAYELQEDLDGYIEGNESETYLNRIDALNESLMFEYNSTNERLTALFVAIDNLQEGVADIEKQAAINAAFSERTLESLENVRDAADALRNDAADLMASFDAMKGRLESISVTRAETIVNPVNAKIEPLLEENSNLQSTAPYLLIMIIMFVSLMISSTLVIFEKNSKALFRSFMTPVPEKNFILSTFFTVVFIVFVQSLIILFAASLFLGQNLLALPVYVLLTILSCIMLFSVLGMAIGSFFSTQEGVMMTSLVLGCVFLFLSNLVIPIESIAPAFASLVKLNPFVVFSEILRGPMMFGTVTPNFALKIGILIWLTLSILAAMLVWKGFFTKKKGLGLRKIVK